MMKMRYAFLAMILCMGIGTTSHAKGLLSDNIRIESQYLGYALQYRLYVPEGVADAASLPTLYVTDGQWYLAEGKIKDKIDTAIASGKVRPFVAVFVDSDDPDKKGRNRRNEQFMCNQKYVQFFTNELVPAISQSQPVSMDRQDRVIMGLSFGATNAACFGLMAYPTFGGLVMQSPANDQHLKLLTDLYRDSAPLPLKIFMSVGTRRDNTKEARLFMKLLQSKQYELTYKEVPFGHDWKNWGPLIDEAIATFFAAP